MDITNFFTISLKKVPCIAGLSEDDLREFINAIQITVKDSDFSGFVKSIGNSDVAFRFDSTGNFSGTSTKVNSQFVKLSTGVDDGELFLFKSSPGGSRPPTGYQLEPDLTRELLKQTGPESGWSAFLASREKIINNP